MTCFGSSLECVVIGWGWGFPQFFFWTHSLLWAGHSLPAVCDLWLYLCSCPMRIETMLRGFLHSGMAKKKRWEQISWWNLSVSTALWCFVPEAYQASSSQLTRPHTHPVFTLARWSCEHCPNIRRALDIFNRADELWAAQVPFGSSLTSWYLCPSLHQRADCLGQLASVEGQLPLLSHPPAAIHFDSSVLETSKTTLIFLVYQIGGYMEQAVWQVGKLHLNVFWTGLGS